MTLKRKTAFGFIWVGVSFVSIQTLNLISSVALARLLAPQDFGHFSLVTVIIFFAATLSELGIGAALIQTKHRNQETINTAFTIIAITSIGLLILTFISSSLIALLFDEPAISSPLKVMTIVILLTSLGVVPASLLERELEFKRRIVAEIIPLIGSVAVSIALALMGFGIWGLVGGAILLSALSTYLVWRMNSFRPHLHFNVVMAKRLLRFGHHIAFGTILLYAVVNLDRLYVGYSADAATLGYYALGLTISNWLGNIAPVINRVMFPAFSRSQGDLKVRGEAYLKVFRFMSFILFPVALGVFLIAPRMVLVVYGEKWLPSVIFIRILVFYGLLRCLNGLIGPVFASAGRPYVSVRIIVLRLLLLLPLMIILDNMLNSAGVALATTLAMALATIYALVLTTNELKLSLRRVAKHISTPFAATVIMGLGVGAVSTLLPMDTLSLVALVVIGAGLYFGSLYILSPQQVLGEVKEAVGVLFPDFAWGRRKI